jgi:EAL domain-containing protein (putative c-di-GMP-specific phosphodiesterase class I)/ActR/RegA family two-component response regulator
MADNLFGNRLLVVDDEPSIGRLVKRVAESVGFEVVATEDPVVFARTARQWHPSVIMLDLSIPGTDGIQLLRGLAADKCAAHIVLISGADGKVLEAAQQLGRERGLNMGKLLQKPTRIETLRELLREFKPVPKSLLAADLAAAIAAGQLFLEYQPKLDCRLGRITAVEALVRWRHPSHGVVRPDQFVAVAEESDLIHRLTDWVVATAAKQAAAWQVENLDLQVAVNISAKDIEDIELPERLHQHCLNAGVDPALMMLELTETGAMREAVQMMDVLTRLRLKGFRLSIDDFGVGYSSLVQLQKMPFSEVKVDSSFVMKMMSNDGCKVIVEIIIDLARKLGLKSVAEGVEEEAALKSLFDMGCDMAQGYYLSRPIAADRIAEFVRGYESGTVLSAATVFRIA